MTATAKQATTNLDEATDNDAIIVAVVLQIAAQLDVLTTAISAALERGVELQCALNAAQTTATVLGVL